MAKTKWSIYTEYVHTRHIAEIVGKYFDAYSMFSGIRHYGGEKERCLVIEIIDGEGAAIDITAICCEINTYNHQQYCLVTSEKVNTMIIADKKRPA